MPVHTPKEKAKRKAKKDNLSKDIMSIKKKAIMAKKKKGK